ncbi:FCD domain-containing protein [Nocardia vinacea]|uniref:FCD domain-containing protein n=1 Tax=Nocardia vinacea TaxID=96468 RepID=UPI0033F3C8D9
MRDHVLMNLSDRQTARQLDFYCVASEQELFEMWALLTIRTAYEAAKCATSEQARSLRVIGAELDGQTDAQAWESITDALLAGLCEACGNRAFEAGRAAVWMSLTGGVDRAPALWLARESINRAVGAVIDAVRRYAPDAAAEGMREHVEAVRTVLFSGEGEWSDRRVVP